MSGPYCNTCVHFQPNPIGKKESGECTDPSKIIFQLGGLPIKSSPLVNGKWSCSNHLTEQSK